MRGSRRDLSAAPAEIDDYNEPQPDLCLLRWRDSYYDERHPTAADVLLLIEISDTTLRYDRSIKRALYARAGVSRYWIVDLRDRSVVVFSEPSSDGYRHEQRLRDRERIELAGRDSELAGLGIEAAELFPPR